MKSIYATVIALMLAAQAAFAQTGLPEAFTDGLEKAKMVFEMPAGFTPTEVKDTQHMKYEYAIKLDTADYEVRYAIRPLYELMRSYEKSLKDPNRVMVDPNTVHFYRVLNTTVLLNIAKKEQQPQEFPDKAVKREFNATKGSVVMVEAKEGFGAGYKYCMMVSIYKESCGTAFYFYMANDRKVMYELTDVAFHSLRFQ